MHQIFTPAMYNYEDPAEEPKRKPTVFNWGSLRSFHVQRGQTPCTIPFNPESFPALQIVHFAGRSGCIFHSHWRLPWTQGTSITLTNHWDPIEHYLYILQECTSLEYFRLEVDWENGEPWRDIFGAGLCVLANPDRTIAPRLKTLHLEITNESIIDELLDQLYAGSLESIHIASRPRRRETPAEEEEEDECEVDFTDEDVIKSLKTLMKRSKCKLHHAQVEIAREVASEEDSKRNEASLVGFFKSTPELKSFSLTNANLEPFPFAHLPPRLEKLKLKLLNPFRSDIKRQFDDWQESLAEKELGSEKPKTLIVTIETETAIAQSKEMVVL